MTAEQPRPKSRGTTQLSILILIISGSVCVCGGEEYLYIGVILGLIGLIGLIVALVRGDLNVLGN